MASHLNGKRARRDPWEQFTLDADAALVLALHQTREVDLVDALDVLRAAAWKTGSVHFEHDGGLAKPLDGVALTVNDAEHDLAWVCVGSLEGQ